LFKRLTNEKFDAILGAIFVVPNSLRMHSSNRLTKLRCECCLRTHTLYRGKAIFYKSKNCVRKKHLHTYMTTYVVPVHTLH